MNHQSRMLSVHKAVLKKSPQILLLGTLLFAVGCQTTAQRSAVVGGAGGLGGGLGHIATDGNALATIGGAAAGAALGNLALGENKSTLQKGFELGYIRGNSDSIKRQYWLMQSFNESKTAGKTAYYTVPIEGLSPDGKEWVQHNITVPIVE